MYLAWLDERDDRLADARRHAEQAVTFEGDVAESRGLLGRILLKRETLRAAARPPRARGVAEPERVVAVSARAGLSTTGKRRGGDREFAEARRLKEQEVARERKEVR